MADASTGGHEVRARFLVVGSSGWPISASISFSVCCARVRAEVKARSNDRPCSFSLRPAVFASAMPSSVRSGSFQPVNRFFRFHSLWPCRTSTRSRSLILLSVPGYWILVTKAEHIGHGVKAGLLAMRP